jgi:hypothetical protein
MSSLIGDKESPIRRVDEGGKSARLLCMSIFSKI